MSETHVRPKRTLKIVLLVGCVVVLLCGGIPLCAGILAIFIPALAAYRAEAVLTDARTHAETLRGAELAWMDTAGEYMACGGPPPQDLEDGYNLDMEDFTPAVASCEALGIAAFALVGAWWVEVSHDGGDFTVHVLVDANDDGTLDATEEVTATALSAATAVYARKSSDHHHHHDFDLF